MTADRRPMTDAGRGGGAAASVGRRRSAVGGRQDVGAVVRLAEAGYLRSAVPQELLPAQANEDLAAVKAGSVMGLLVLVP